MLKVECTWMAARCSVLGSVALGGSAAAAALGGHAFAGSGSAKPKKLIVVVCEGGWDVTFAFDPKYHVDDIIGPEVDLADNRPVEDEEDERTFGGITLATNPFKYLVAPRLSPGLPCCRSWF